ncbi:four-carbon acid sugar kinase family protein [Arcanobacterium haemolyticum]|nr:four-carbon acid sugar kinase family protein [Arcanobacterium haemolyticum]
MIQIGAIADDFTGATDLAFNLRKRGISAAVVMGYAIDEHEEDIVTQLEGIESVVVAHKTRSAPAQEARNDSLEALAFLRRLGVTRFYQKYCSTFDSLPTGNIGPILDVLADAVDAKKVVVVPAYPDNDRTMYRGHLFVKDELLAESPMKDHPLNPMTDSRISRVLTPQTRYDVSEVHLADVRAGTEHLRQAICAAPGRYVCVDALTNEDLAAICEATSDFPLRSGGAGLVFDLQPTTGKTAEIPPVGEGGCLVVSGSASAMTRAQIAHAAQTGAHMIKLDPVAAAENPGAYAREIVESLEKITAHASPTDREQRVSSSYLPVVYATGELSDITEARRIGETAGVNISECFEQVLSEVVALTTQSGLVNRVICAGGETSGAIVSRLNLTHLTTGEEIAPGVGWCYTTVNGRNIALALKSGNFGDEDMFTTAWEKIHA